MGIRARIDYDGVTLVWWLRNGIRSSTVDITFVTTNRGKAESLRRVLEPHGFSVTQVALDLLEPQLTNLQEIAEHKARLAYQELQRPLVVQDSGFGLDAWNGFPGAFVKFALQTLDLEGILALVEGRSRLCEFRECLSYFDGMHLHSFEATVRGTVAPEARGDRHPEATTRLWRVFVPEGYEKTLAEMTEPEREVWRQTRPPNYGSLFANWLTGPTGPVMR